MLVTEKPAPRSEDQTKPKTSAAGPPLILPSEELLQGRREIWIEHGQDMYRLRVTANNKLYLTK